MTEQPRQNTSEQPVEGGTKVIDGKLCRRVPSGYTVRQYFSHSTPEQGSGPGWDRHLRALEEYGVDGVEDLPDEPYFRWEPVED